MQAIEVGKKFFGDYKQEGVRLSYNGGFFLEIILADLTTSEINSVGFGNQDFGLTLIDDVLFFTCQFGDTIAMSDAPFHFGLYKDARINDLPKNVENGEGLALNIIAIDARSGIVKALRVIALSTEFSRMLIVICLMQSGVDVNGEDYDKQLARIQKQYSSSDLYNKALVKYSTKNSTSV